VERIQEAIEKARRERQGNIGKSSQTAEAKQSGSNNEQTDDTPAPERAPQVRAGETGVSQSPAGKSSIRINYSQTKTVSMSEDELKDRRIVANFAHDARSEPYRQLRGQVLKKFRENKWQTLAVTSPNSGSGSTLTALNLAISLSFEANQTVLLVDLNLRNPGVATCMGINDIEYGIADYVRGEKPLEDILVNPGFERLVLLPGTPQGAFTSEVLSSPEMQSVTNELVERYPSRIIIFDLPSVLSNDDALVFAPKCDATLMVLEEGGSKKQDIERAYQLLEGCNVIGSVLNKVRYA